MPKRKKIDGKALVKMIKEEATQADIMKKFGFKNSTQLKVAYANALMETGEAPEIKGKPKAAKPVSTKVTVNARGSLIIPKALIDSMNFPAGKTFDTKKTAVGIQLKSV